MRVSPINLYSAKPNNINNKVSCPISFGIGRKTSGGIEDKKRSESLEIAYTMGDINKTVKYAKQSGKTLYKIGKTLLKSGKKIDYQNYKIVYNASKNQKVIFGDINNETGCPSSISVVTCSDRLETDKIFELKGNSANPFSSYTVTEKNAGWTYKWKMNEDKLVSYSEQRDDGNITYLYLPEKNGFSYKEINKEKGKEPEEVTTINYCDNKKNPKFDYIRTKAWMRTQILGHFTYNQQTKMWERQDNIDIKG